MPALSIRALARFARLLRKRISLSSRGFRHGQGTALHDAPQPPHAVERTFRLFLYEIGVYSSVSLSVPFLLRMLN